MAHIFSYVACLYYFTHALTAFFACSIPFVGVIFRPLVFTAYFALIFVMYRLFLAYNQADYRLFLEKIVATLIALLPLRLDAMAVSVVVDKNIISMFDGISGQSRHYSIALLAAFGSRIFSIPVSAQNRNQ